MVSALRMDVTSKRGGGGNEVGRRAANGTESGSWGFTSGGYTVSPLPGHSLDDVPTHLSNVIHNHGRIRIAEIYRRQRLVPLLASLHISYNRHLPIPRPLHAFTHRVPDLKLDVGCLVEANGLREESS